MIRIKFTLTQLQYEYTINNLFLNRKKYYKRKEMIRLVFYSAMNTKFILMRGIILN